MHPGLRLVAILVLVGVVFGLGVHYDAAEAGHSPYPSSTEIAVNYDAHVGEEAFVFGRVLTVDDNRATIEVDSDRGVFQLTVDGFGKEVQTGGVVQVYGTLRPDRTINAENTVVVNPAEESNRYKYAVSTVGAALVLAAFLRKWRFDTDSLAFEVRGDG